MTADRAASNPAAGGAGGSGAAPVPLLNIANVLTVVRLALVPVFLLALFWAGGHDTLWRVVATAVFVLAAVTDRVDGDLARRRGLVTDFGKVVDPIADKALTGSALLGLSALGELWWWATAVIIGRELLVTGLRLWVIRHGVIPASRGGKLKTLLQTVAVVLYLLPVDALAPARWTLLAAALLVTVLTGLDYCVQAVRLRAAARRNRAGG